MDTSPVAPSRQTRLTAWLALLLLAALGWAVLIQQTHVMNSTTPSMAGSSGTNQDMSGMNMAGMNATTPSAVPMAAGPVSLVLYLPVWVSMMVAMMFPAAAPVVSLFATLSHNRRTAGQPAAPTWIFLAGYLVVWSLLGVGAYLLSSVLPALGMMAPGLRVDYPVAAGVVLIFAGFYQLSPLKQACLRHCRSPISVIMHGWHDGFVGAFRMGLEHGAFCLGCCWGLMLVLFVVGIMNLPGMVLLSTVIFVEKVVWRGPLIGRLIAVALIALGVLTLVTPLLNRPMG